MGTRSRGESVAPQESQRERAKTSEPGASTRVTTAPRKLPMIGAKTTGQSQEMGPIRFPGHAHSQGVAWIGRQEGLAGRPSCLVIRSPESPGPPGQKIQVPANDLPILLFVGEHVPD